MKKQIVNTITTKLKKNIFMMKIFTIDAPHNQLHNVHIQSWVVKKHHQCLLTWTPIITRSFKLTPFAHATSFNDVGTMKRMMFNFQNKGKGKGLIDMDKCVGR